MPLNNVQHLSSLTRSDIHRRNALRAHCGKKKEYVMAFAFLHLKRVPMKSFWVYSGCALGFQNGLLNKLEAIIFSEKALDSELFKTLVISTKQLEGLHFMKND